MSSHTRILCRLEGWATGLAVVALAGTLCAQTEQWLEYHTSQEYLGYRNLELATNAPPGVRLPALNRDARFAFWKTPLDAAGGRWVCIDRKGKSGAFDRLFIDRNGNGQLDDDAAEQPQELSQSSSEFGPTRIVFKGEDGPVTYHLSFRSYNFEDKRIMLLVQSGGYYQGQVSFGGKKRPVKLIDRNVNGTFNDCATDPANADCIEVGNEPGNQRYLGKLLELDQQFWHLNVARDGAFVTVRKAENVVLGKARMPAEISEFSAVGDQGHFTRKPEAGVVTLPLGTYRPHDWKLVRKDDKQASWQLSGSGFPKDAAFEIKASDTATLRLGEPIRAALRADESKSAVRFSLQLQGSMNETVTITREGQRPRAPQLMLASGDRSWRQTYSFEYG
jgi:hypothetical protein